MTTSPAFRPYPSLTKMLMPKKSEDAPAEPERWGVAQGGKALISTPLKILKYIEHETRRNNDEFQLVGIIAPPFFCKGC